MIGLTLRGTAFEDHFAALAQRFEASKHKNTDLEALKAAIRARLEKLVRLNRTRADFTECSRR